MVLFHAGTGLLREILTSPLRTHDMSQATQLHPALQPGDIGLGDRGFCSYAHLALLKLKGVFGVFRIHQMIKVDFQSSELSAATETGRKRRLARWLHRLGAMDQLVEWVKPKKAPKWMTADEYAKLPGHLVVRQLRYPVGRPGFRTKEVTLVTTLLDAELYPLLALAELYRQRWQAEQHWRELKTTLRMEVLRCKTLDGRAQRVVCFCLSVQSGAGRAGCRGTPSTLTDRPVEFHRCRAVAEIGEAGQRLVQAGGQPGPARPGGAASGETAAQRI